MTKLYSEYAEVYYAMYQSLFDYEKDFNFFNNILKKFKCKSVLELACGTGNLASYFIKENYEYIGLDLYKEMLEIAKRNTPEATFVQGDMRNFNFQQNFDSIIIPGRSFCYLISNDDVNDALKSIYINLKKGGILMFDNFKAESIFADFTREIKNVVTYKTKKYTRVSKKKPNLKTGWTWNWIATYYIEDEKGTRILNDKSILRAFTKDELSLFLALNNLKIVNAFDDDGAFTTIAQK